MTIAIRTEDLTKYFVLEKDRVVCANDHINLSIRRGEIFGLIGPNGAGKTTFIKLVSGLLDPSEGTAYIEGHDIRDVKHRINQMCLATYGGWSNLFSSGIARLPSGKALRYVGKAWGIKGDLKKIADYSLELVGLSEFSNTPVVKFSSGMQRKLELATILMRGAHIYCLDEPTIHLDPPSAHSFCDVLRRLVKEEEKTFLLTSQDMDVVEYSCDEVGFLYNGKLVMKGSITTIRGKLSQEKIVRLVLSQSPRHLKNLLEKIDGVRRVEERGGASYRIHVLRDRDIFDEIFHIVSEENLKMLEFYEEKPTLTDIFDMIIGGEFS